jgi:sulfur-oxidizing protein SoxY
MQTMTQRRRFIKFLIGAASLALIPMRALAAAWNAPAFQATQIEEALAGLGLGRLNASSLITVIAPDKAENGAVVQIEITSNIPNTESIAILVDKNPTSLIAYFKFSQGADPFVVTRIKMAETSDVQAVIKADNQYFVAKKRVEVLENGCG